MLSLPEIKNFAIKFQTTEINILREYFQHLYLSYFYQSPEAQKVYFKGGTSLRFVYNSPRFSEDLDFSSTLNEYKISKIVIETVKRISIELDVSLEDAKPTSGGFLAILKTKIYEMPLRIELNISLRKKDISGETILISPKIIPAYTANILKENQLVKEKIQAAIYRKKPRDYFDLYYILRARIALEEIFPYKQKIIKDIEVLNNKEIRNELKIFLPQSYWAILKNFKDVLLKELERL